MEGEGSNSTAETTYTVMKYIYNTRYTLAIQYIHSLYNTYIGYAIANTIYIQYNIYSTAISARAALRAFSVVSKS